MPDEVPIVCTLGRESLRGRREEWQSLLTHAVDRREIEHGVRVEFDAGLPAGELMRLVAAEQHCCQFFRFAITVDTRGIGLEVTAPSDAWPIVESLFGVPRVIPRSAEDLVKSAAEDVYQRDSCGTTELRARARRSP